MDIFLVWEVVVSCPLLSEKAFSDYRRNFSWHRIFFLNFTLGQASHDMKSESSDLAMTFLYIYSSDIGCSVEEECLYGFRAGGPPFVHYCIWLVSVALS